MILDTNLFVATERGRFDLDAFLDAAGDVPAFISAVTASELLVGVHRADPAHATRRGEFAEYVIRRFPTLPFDLRVARVRAAVAAQMAAAGTPVGVLDLMIAAPALADGHEVISFDLRSFPRVPGLRVRTPSTSQP